MRIVWTVVFLLIFLPAVAGAQIPEDAPPDAPPQIRLGGYIQYDYLAPLGDETDAADTFRFRRVRLLGSGAITGAIDWTVSAEATSTPVLRDAYVTLKYFPAATVRVGQMVMPFGLEQYLFSSNVLAFTERIATELVASRDAGIIVSNERPFLGWLSYAAAVTNGTRQNVPDNNSAKDGIVRLTMRPPRLNGLQLGVNAMKGAQPDGMRTRTGADVSFERRLFHIAAEVDRQQTGDDPRKLAAYLFGAWRIYPRTVHPGFHHLEFGTRFGSTRNLATPLNQWDLSANYYVHPKLRSMCSLILHRARAAGIPPAIFHARANIRF
ncbi:MAG: OprO/OprP family phosphate-selective porin [Acidobacteria bacterium]|nr:OprO/OprP family phosphate-selective porin [Acidobacteriota bacterium]MCA1649792.1 OprO/OprP family phosphate-selective porin [Acidobacteriota bacterium]